MKTHLSKLITIMLLLFCSNVLMAQNLQWRGYQLKAHYPLDSNGVDKTGNYDTISYGNHQFIDNSILSKGCRLNDRTWSFKR